MPDTHSDLCLPAVNGRLFACFFGGGGSTKQKPPPKIVLPKTPEFRMPDIPAANTSLPPAAVPPPVQTTTTDQGQAEDDARTSALRRRGLTGTATLFSGEGGFQGGLGAGKNQTLG